MKTHILFFTIILTAFSLNTFSQTRITAHFSDTETTVFRDSSNHLIMSYTITGIETEEQLNKVKQKFEKYGIFDSFEIRATSNTQEYIVTETTNPGIKIKDHKKLFATCGIAEIDVDGTIYATENFSVKILRQSKQ